MRIFLIALRVAFAVYAGLALCALVVRPAAAVSWSNPHHAYITFSDASESYPWRVEEISLNKHPKPPQSLLGQFCVLDGLAIGPRGNLYIAGLFGEQCNPAIEIFAPGAHGRDSPTAVIEGSLTELNLPESIAFDRAGNLYDAQVEGSLPTGAINEYAAGATGNVAPIARIAGAQTGLGYVFGLAVDDRGEIFTDQIDGIGSKLSKFAAGSTGNIAPEASATVNSTNEINVSGNTLYASMPTYRRFNPSVDEFSTNDFSMTGTLTNSRFTFPFVDVDSQGRMYVQNFIHNDLRQLRGQLFEFGAGGEGPDRVRFDGLAEVGGYITVGP